MTVAEADPRKLRAHPRNPGGLFVALFLSLGLLAALLFCGWVVLQRFHRLYNGHVYPNVFALGVDLGGLSQEEAAAAVRQAASQVDTGLLVLMDADRSWSYPWPEAGLQFDAEAMVQEAMAVGRTGDWRDELRVLLRYTDVPPRFTFDTLAARTLLEGLSNQISIQPTQATLALQAGQVVVVPGEPGRVMDITNTLARMQASSGSLDRVEVPLEFQAVEPAVPDTAEITAAAELLLARMITIQAYDVLTDRMLSWNLGRDMIARWLYLVPGPDGKATVDVNLHALRESLVDLAATMADGRGFRYDEAAQQVFAAFDAGEPIVTLYLTHPERIYAVESGDTLTSLSAKFGMPPGLVAEANPDIDIDKLYVGQEIKIPSQDILTPYLPVLGKRIVVNVAEQRVRVYEGGALLWEWVVSTGMKDSPTHRGVFQVISKDPKAYASQWDLWMPYFIGVYVAGGSVTNGFHELPILANGQRLWAGSLGRPASFGCIILGIPQAETLYAWAEIGVVVVIE